MLNPPATVTVAVPTYRRPVELRRCLDSLAAMKPGPPGCWVETLVIDNEGSDETTRIVCEFSDALPGLRLVVESETGVVAVRNRAVVEAQGMWLACIDDDMTASEGWLDDLLDDAEQHGRVSAVVGRYVARYQEGVKPSVRASRILEYQHWLPGTEIDTLRTGNCLLRLDELPDPPFDAGFSRLGGEDHHLGRMLSLQGTVIASKALATEWIDASQVDGPALRLRARRFGAAWYRVERCSRSGTWQSTVMPLSKAVAKMVLFAPGLVPIGHSWRWRAHQRFWFGVGALGAALGRRPSGY